MARLDFDFHGSRPRPALLGIGLALLGAAALAWTWNTVQKARATDAGLALQIAALQQVRPHRAVRPANPAETAAVAARAAVARQLAYSWQPVFDTLAAAHSNKIALLALDATRATGQVKLIAEARQLADALTFVETLQQQPGVRRASLVQHEVQASADQQPVRFNVLLELRP